MAFLSKLGNYRSTALLVMRLFVGASMILHGYPKLMGGVEKWTSLGKNMKYLGINAYPEVWGFMAAFSESICAVLIIIGFLFRPSAFLIFFTMVVATIVHLNDVEVVKTMDKISDASHAIELAAVFFGLFLLGPGRFSIDKD
jgi:putative oxidoreductase